MNSLYENPSMPRRKILLSVGANNYRPPMERSKSAPKLMSIEEADGEEEDICSASSRRAQTHSLCYNSEWNPTLNRKYCRRNKSATNSPLASNYGKLTSLKCNQWNRNYSKS